MIAKRIVAIIFAFFIGLAINLSLIVLFDMWILFRFIVALPFIWGVLFLGFIERSKEDE